MYINHICEELVLIFLRCDKLVTNFNMNLKCILSL